MVLVESLVWGEPFAVRRSPRRSNVKRASSPVAFDGAVTHLQKFHSLQSRNDGRGRPSHNVETSPQGARRSTTSFIPFAVRRSPFTVRSSPFGVWGSGFAGRCGWRHTALTITMPPKLSSLQPLRCSAPLW